MLKGILKLDKLQWLPSRSDFTPILWLWYRTWPLLNSERFSWSVCNKCDMPARNAYHSGHLVPSFSWLAYALFVETFFPSLSCFSRLFLVGQPSVLYRFCFNRTSLVVLVTPTDRPKSVRNHCVIELFCGVVCVVALPFWHFCWCRGFCHRTESDLVLFLFLNISDVNFHASKSAMTFSLLPVPDWRTISSSVDIQGIQERSPRMR